MIYFNLLSITAKTAIDTVQILDRQARKDFYKMANFVEDALFSPAAHQRYQDALKTVTILSLVTIHLLQIVYIVSADIAAQHVEIALDKTEKIEPAQTIDVIFQELETAMPTIFQSVIVDLSDLDIDELRQIAKDQKVKGWNLIKKRETMIAKIEALSI